MSDPKTTSEPTLQDILEMHPADIADRVQRLDEDDARELIAQLPPDLAAKTLAEVEEEKLPGVLETFSAEQLAHFFGRLAPEVAVDMVQQLPATRRRDIVSLMPSEAAASVRTLLKYPEESAGGIMTNRFITLRQDMTVDAARQTVAARAEKQPAQDIAYLYVTDDDDRLAGIISLRDLVFRPSGRNVGDIMNRDVVHALVTDDQEELAS